MAFGHTDTDAIYTIIKRTLKPLGITLRRVDRIEHNENIDSKIISEIEGADLVIADLTYARPSVYFESGYAQRKIPVVYTARRDHFRERADDKHGNFHVHFDLKMRNIISWSSTTDSEFPTRLKARVTKVIAPTVRQTLESLSHEEHLAAFERLSLFDKRRILFDTALSHFKRAHYKTMDLRGQNENLTTPFIIHSSMRSGAFAATRRVRTIFNFVFCQCLPTITVNSGQRYYPWLAFPPYDADHFNLLTNAPSEIMEDILIISLGSAGLNRLQKQIPSARRGTFDNTLAYDITSNFSRYKKKVPDVMRHITFHLFESTSRLVRLSEILRERFPYR
jgi:nucleoside 2-deoxyribosyltransferase